MTRFVITIATQDFKTATFFAYGDDGNGSVRDCNHATECARVWCETSNGQARQEPPPEGWIRLFDVYVGIEQTRRGNSVYRGADYKRYPKCTNGVAQAGMEVYYDLKRVIREAARLAQEEGGAK